MAYKKVYETSAGAVIIDPLKKQILMIQSNVGRGGWGFPKGHIEMREEPIDTAKREATEETGLDAQNMAFISELETVKQVIRYPKSQEIAYRETKFFLFQVSCSCTDNLSPDNAHKKAMWISFSDLGKIRTRYKYVLSLASRVIDLD